jgi:DNA/RNA endonuclease YhcR with UshA esterase domain
MNKTLSMAVTIIACGVLLGFVWATFGSDEAETRPSQPGTVTAVDAADHVGETITLKGIVSEVHVSPRATFINFGGRYPDEKFTGVIFLQSAGAFPDVDAYEGKTVDITGTVQLYRGRPEVVLTSPSQIWTE